MKFLNLNKTNKKRLIQFIFLIPFITCLLTVIGIKHYVDYRIPPMMCNPTDTHRVFVVIAFVLLVNVVASFASLISYYCLENRVEDILQKREKDAKK